MEKVNFLVVGAQKGGTTTLHHCLSQHPDIVVSDPKELHYFDNDQHFNTEDVDHSYYEDRFASMVTSQQIIGEVTPIYLYWEPCMKRIADYNPDMKLIVLLRDPVARAYSHWQMEFNKGKETLSFDEAIYLERERLEYEGIQQQHRVYSYLDRGFYTQQIHRMLQYFDRSQILFLKSEDMVYDMEVALYQVFTFLGVDYISVDHAAKHIGDYQKSLTKKQRDDLVAVYSREIQAVESLLGWDCSDWLDHKLVHKNHHAKKKKRSLSVHH